MRCKILLEYFYRPIPFEKYFPVIENESSFHHECLGDVIFFMI